MISLLNYLRTCPTIMSRKVKRVENPSKKDVRTWKSTWSQRCAPNVKCCEFCFAGYIGFLDFNFHFDGLHVLLTFVSENRNFTAWFCSFALKNIYFAVCLTFGLRIVVLCRVFDVWSRIIVIWRRVCNISSRIIAIEHSRFYILSWESQFDGGRVTLCLEEL